MKNNEANISGEKNELLFEELLKQKSISYEKQPNFTKPCGRRGKSDFLIFTNNNKKIRVENKFQNVPGSKEETIYCFLYYLENNCFTEDYICLILSGKIFEKTTKIYQFLFSKQTEKFKIFRLEDLNDFFYLMNNG